MKKQLLLGSALLAAISAFPQTGKLKQTRAGLENAKLVAKLKYSEEAPVNTTTPASETAPQTEEYTSKTNAINTWQKISGSMNILNSVIPYENPLQYNDEINTVSFIHRKSATYSATPQPAAVANSGVIVGMVTSNWGTTWDSTVLYSNDTEWGRYPQGGIYNPPGNTVVNNAYIIGQGPTTAAAGGWLGNYYASRKLGVYTNAITTNTNEMQWYSKNAPYPVGLPRHDFAAYAFTSTDDGKVRTIGGVTDEVAAADSALMIVTGSFNAGAFTWVGTRLNPSSLINSNDGSDEFVSRPLMAWNEAGTVGYAAVVGARSGATGSNKGYQPIVFKTTNSGLSWNEIAGIDFNSPAFADVLAPLDSADSFGVKTKQIPFFNWVEGMDMAVDASNKLHFFATVIPSSIDHPDSLGYIGSYAIQGENYRWPHVPGQRPYLYDFIGDGTSAWTHIKVDSMSSESASGTSGGYGFNENPWDLDPSGNKPRMEGRLQLSRTPDGQHIIYTWAESDTNFTNNAKKFNVLPNVKARCYSVASGTVLSGEINITKPAVGANPNISSRAMFFFASPTTSSLVAGSTAANPRFTMPITVTTGNPYTQTAPFHWYMSADLNFSTVGLTENALSSAANSVVYPNPASGNATLNIDLKNNSEVNVVVMNTIGQVVKNSTANGQIGENNINIDLAGLSSGIYLVNIKIDGASSTKKIIVE